MNKETKTIELNGALYSTVGLVDFFSTYGRKPCDCLTLRYDTGEDIVIDYLEKDALMIDHQRVKIVCPDRWRRR